MGTATVPRLSAIRLTALHAEMQRWYARGITFTVARIHGRATVTFTMDAGAFRWRNDARAYADAHRDELLCYLGAFGSLADVSALAHMAYGIMRRQRWIDAEMRR